MSCIQAAAPQCWAAELPLQGCHLPVLQATAQLMHMRKGLCPCCEASCVPVAVHPAIPAAASGENGSIVTSPHLLCATWP